MENIDVFFITGKSSGGYNGRFVKNGVNKDRRRFKFLYWNESKLLIVGNVSEHRDLLKIFAHLKKDYVYKLEDHPDGAGGYWGLKITGWRSLGFDICTPEALRPIILRALARVVEE